LDQVKIIQLANAYALTKQSVDFTALHNELLPVFRRRWLARRDIDPHDAESAFNSALWEIAEGWTESYGDDFMKPMNTRYKMRLTDQLRRLPDRTRELSYEELIEESEDKAGTSFTDERENTELTVIKKMTESGREPIIDHLLLQSRSDIATTRIVAALRVTPFESRESLAKATGLHHEAVKRKLRALSRNYDINRFGDIRDYLAV
jgi:hypothetical protein